MAVAIRMPKLGMTMEEGSVVAWPLALGARVEKGQLVLVIESEKTEAEIEATASGFLRHVYVPAGDVVPCGTLLAALTESADEAFDAAAFAAAEAPLAPKPKPSPPAPAVSAAPAARAAERKAIAPAARALAKKLGLDAEAMPGSGPGGRVTKEDVEAFAAARARLVTVANGVALEVLREGQGTPVLLIPGFGSDVSSFALQTPRLVERFRVLALNPRGVGGSDAPADARYEVGQLASDAAAVLAAAGGDAPAHVVGASLGAAVAIELALAHPERVRSLTLITPFTTATPRLLAVIDAWRRIGAEASPAAVARCLAPLLFSDALLADESARERTLRGLAAACARIPAPTLERMAAGLAAWSGTRAKDVARIRVPTLVLAAGADLLTPDAEAVARAIPGAKLHVIVGAGHALSIEAAQPVTDALLAHIDDCPGGDR
jgi:pyruvate dehydrogenase E2 component (dihydrolipoamide acetyltransferase)